MSQGAQATSRGWEDQGDVLTKSLQKECNTNSLMILAPNLVRPSASRMGKQYTCMVFSH